MDCLYCGELVGTDGIRRGTAYMIVVILIPIMITIRIITMIMMRSRSPHLLRFTTVRPRQPQDKTIVSSETGSVVVPCDRAGVQTGARSPQAAAATARPSTTTRKPTASDTRARTQAREDPQNEAHTNTAQTPHKRARTHARIQAHERTSVNTARTDSDTRPQTR
jgi:hypothetical protein